VDDHSTDNSWEVLESFAKKDPRIKIFKRPEDRIKGGNAARNFAFENSKGEFIQWLDSDDIILPRKIEYQVEELKINSKFSVSLSNWEGFTNSLSGYQEKYDNSRWELYPTDGYGFLLRLWEKESFVPPHAYLMTRNLVLKSGLWHEDLIQNQDGEFMTRVLLKSDKIIFNNKITTFYRLPDKTHLSRQTNYKSWNDWYDSLVLCDNWMLDYKNSKKARKVLSLNYERLIKLIAMEYPEISEKALNRIKFLNPGIRFNFSKPSIIWFGSWIGIKNFFMLRKFLMQLRISKF
jgi:glycosyltransferase involved in cell wall biosynthesis